MDMRHNYAKKIVAMIEAGEIPHDVGVNKLDIYHDNDCAVFSGGICDCDPIIRYTPLIKKDVAVGG